MSSIKRIACKIKMYLKQNLEMIKKEKETLVLVLYLELTALFFLSCSTDPFPDDQVENFEPFDYKPH